MANGQKFQVFDERFTNDELSEEFHAFFYKYNLTPLFTNEHMASPITVTYLDAKSVLNDGGKYQKDLLELSDLLTIANDNKSYEEALFKIIHEPRSFQAMMRKIRDLINFIKHVDERFKGNTWNIVWYAKELR